MSSEPRFAFRATAEDFANLTAIAAALRTAGQPFANRTDALRHALRTAAADMTAAPAGETGR